MADAELHRKILEFLMAEWARKENRQLVAVDLLYAPGGGYKDEPIRKWMRADEPEFFAEFVNVEKLVSLIIEIAEGEADSKPAGRHRFKVATQQYLGERPYMSFSLQPSYTGGDDAAIVPFGGGAGGGGRAGADVAVAQILAGNNAQLMRTNTQMFDGTIRVLGQQTLNMHEQITTLLAENTLLRKKLEEAESNKMDREFQIAMAADKNARANAAIQKVLQISTVVAAKFAGGNGGAQQLGEAGSLPMLINELKQSLRQDQLGALMQIFDMPQKMLFMEIVNKASPPEPPPQGPPGQPPPGGFNGQRS